MALIYHHIIALENIWRFFLFYPFHMRKTKQNNTQTTTTTKACSVIAQLQLSVKPFKCLLNLKQSVCMLPQVNGSRVPSSETRGGKSSFGEVFADPGGERNKNSRISWGFPFLPWAAPHACSGIRAVLHNFPRISIHKGTSVRGLRKIMGAGPGGKAGKKLVSCFCC